MTAPVPKAPAGPVREHIKYLIHQGMTQAEIIRRADLTSPYLAGLLHGEHKRGKAPVGMMNAHRAARILAIRYEPPEPGDTLPAVCPSGAAFEMAGYKVGRCLECGQIAPVQTRAGRSVIFSHPRPEPDAGQFAAAVLVSGRHPDCGTPRGHNRHSRERTPHCEPCKAAKRGYEQGRNSVLSAIYRAQQAAVPWSLIGECEAAARAVVFRKPYPQLREVFVRFLRAVEAARESAIELDLLSSTAPAELSDGAERRAA